MKLENLRDLLLHNIQDLYSAENQITVALPKMAAKATSPQLRKSFESHLKETQNQITRLTQIGELLGEKVDGETCLAMKGLVKEGDHFMKEDMSPEVADAGMIVIAQKVEHYEIAGYGACICWAKELGEDQVAALLEETLVEEKAADQKLTAVAEARVNVAAEKAKAEKA